MGHFPAIQRVRSTSQLADNYSGDVVSTLRYPATNFRHILRGTTTFSSVVFIGTFSV